MKFNSPFIDRRNSSHTRSGSKMVPVCVLQTSNSGEQFLEQVSESNQYLSIQSHAASVDINNVLARYNSGDYDIINKVQGFFADVSGLPGNLMDALNYRDRTKAIFDELPAEIRSMFNNSFIEFGNADADTINSIFNPAAPVDSAPVPDSPLPDSE